MNYTQLLPNSPMNEPSYRHEHGITAGHGEIVKESATYTRADWEEMARLREAFSLFDTWGVLRYVALFVRQETGIKEVEFYNRLQADAGRAPQRWPFLSGALRVVPLIMSPPASWALFLAEVQHYLIDRLGVRDDDALRTVISVQRAHLPAPERSFPETVALKHDFPAWYRAVQSMRDDGHRDDWETLVPRCARMHPANWSSTIRTTSAASASASRWACSRWRCRTGSSSRRCHVPGWGRSPRSPRAGTTAWDTSTCPCLSRRTDTTSSETWTERRTSTRIRSALR